jgi:uncharacterized protein YjiS (DUF1127 family)
MISEFLRNARGRIAKRRNYNRLVDEIQALTNRDLVDMGADRSEMLHQTYQHFYGRK